MKIAKRKLLITMVLLTLLVAIPQVYAKTSIEIKPNSSLVYTNKTISDFFDESLAMKNIGEGLEGINADVHMAKNTEWAIVSYFSNSAYGTNGEGQNAGITISLDGKEYRSTNGNATGVMDFGKTETYTAGVISNYTRIGDSSETEEPYDYGKSIIENATNSKYVDLINTVSAKSMAVTAWYNSQGWIASHYYEPFSVRYGLFGFVGGDSRWDSVYGQVSASGMATTYTFRPVIWN